MKLIMVLDWFSHCIQ
uniref:Uncharacterized protein n=1 Tax=Rhizophora mucronata TaxID=61149 RepID=A0A2P2NLS5_RHIMU